MHFDIFFFFAFYLQALFPKVGCLTCHCDKIQTPHELEAKAQLKVTGEAVERLSRFSAER